MHIKLRTLTDSEKPHYCSMTELSKRYNLSKNRIIDILIEKGLISSNRLHSITEVARKGGFVAIGDTRSTKSRGGPLRNGNPGPVWRQDYIHDVICTDAEAKANYEQRMRKCLLTAALVLNETASDGLACGQVLEPHRQIELALEYVSPVFVDDVRRYLNDPRNYEDNALILPA